MDRTDTEWKEWWEKKGWLSQRLGMEKTKIRLLPSPALPLDIIKTFRDINYFELNKDFIDWTAYCAAILTLWTSQPTITKGSLLFSSCSKSWALTSNPEDQILKHTLNMEKKKWTTKALTGCTWPAEPTALCTLLACKEMAVGKKPLSNPSRKHLSASYGQLYLNAVAVKQVTWWLRKPCSWKTNKNSSRGAEVCISLITAFVPAEYGHFRSSFHPRPV